MLDELSTKCLYKTVKIQFRINERIYPLPVKLYLLQKNIWKKNDFFFFCQTQNRDVASFHGANLLQIY